MTAFLVPLDAHEEGLSAKRPFLYDQAPRLAYLELTQACDLACQHCRADAVARRHPLELSTAEWKDVLRELRRFGDPPVHVVFTGGDPLHRDDLFELLEFALGMGLGVSVAPAATERLTRDVLQRFKEMGVQGISLSLDGSDADKHDTFRRVPGCFERTLEAARDARDAGLSLQINTLVTESTLPDLLAIHEVVSELDIDRWAVFFLISVGRGQVLQPISPAEAERLMHDLAMLNQRSPFAIKTTEAMHYRRVAYRRMHREVPNETILQSPLGRGFGIRDGNGIFFISHIGSVWPAGFLPLAAGNVRRESPVTIYRDSELFRSLRNPDRFQGKCGICEYRWICGGSRSRAYAATGNPLASDPLCPYQPKGGPLVLGEESAN